MFLVFEGYMLVLVELFFEFFFEVLGCLSEYGNKLVGNLGQRVNIVII